MPTTLPTRGGGDGKHTVEEGSKAMLKEDLAETSRAARMKPPREEKTNNRKMMPKAGTAKEEKDLVSYLMETGSILALAQYLDEED